MKRALATTVLLAGLAFDAGAQIIRPTIVTRPTMYTSLSIGWLRQWPICDPDNNACWTFVDAAQYRAAFEVPLGIATTAGVSYAHAQVPLNWSDASGCSPFCEASTEMHSFMALLHMGTTGTYQQLIDLAAGATRFANFKTTSGAPLGTGKGVTDFTFSVAYGLGIGLTRNLHFTLQQEYGVVFHKRFNNSASGAAEQQTLRAGLRLGM